MVGCGDGQTIDPLLSNTRLASPLCLMYAQPYVYPWMCQLRYRTTRAVSHSHILSDFPPLAPCVQRTRTPAGVEPDASYIPLAKRKRVGIRPASSTHYPLPFAHGRPYVCPSLLPVGTKYGADKGQGHGYHCEHVHTPHDTFACRSLACFKS